MTLWLFLLAILSILEGFPYIPNTIHKKVLKSSFFPHKQKQHIRFANKGQKYHFLRQQIQALLREQENEKEYLSQKPSWNQKEEYGEEKKRTGVKKISLLEDTQQSQFQDEYDRNQEQYKKNEHEFLYLKHKILGLKKQLKRAKKEKKKVNEQIQMAHLQREKLTQQKSKETTKKNIRNALLRAFGPVLQEQGNQIRIRNRASLNTQWWEKGLEGDDDADDDDDADEYDDDDTSSTSNKSKTNKQRDEEQQERELELALQALDRQRLKMQAQARANNERWHKGVFRKGMFTKLLHRSLPELNQPTSKVNKTVSLQTNKTPSTKPLVTINTLENKTLIYVVPCWANKIPRLRCVDGSEWIISHHENLGICANRNGRALCPSDLPWMCQRNHHCHQDHQMCAEFGGLRPCEEKNELKLKSVEHQTSHNHSSNLLVQAYATIAEANALEKKAQAAEEVVVALEERYDSSKKMELVVEEKLKAVQAEIIAEKKMVEAAKNATIASKAEAKTATSRANLLKKMATVSGFSMPQTSKKESSEQVLIKSNVFTSQHPTLLQQDKWINKNLINNKDNNNRYQNTYDNVNHLSRIPPPSFLSQLETSAKTKRTQRMKNVTSWPYWLNLGRRVKNSTILFSKHRVRESPMLHRVADLTDSSSTTATHRISTPNKIDLFNASEDQAFYLEHIKDINSSMIEELYNILIKQDVEQGKQTYKDKAKENRFRNSVHTNNITQQISKLAHSILGTMGHAIDGKQNADITGQDLPNQLNDKLPHYSNYQMYKGMGATVRNNKQYEVESINKLPISSHRYQHNQQQQKQTK